MLKLWGGSGYVARVKICMPLAESVERDVGRGRLPSAACVVGDAMTARNTRCRIPIRSLGQCQMTTIPSFSAKHWIDANCFGGHTLKRESVDVVSNFTLMWSLFEGI